MKNFARLIDALSRLASVGIQAFEAFQPYAPREIEEVVPEGAKQVIIGGLGLLDVAERYVQSPSDGEVTAAFEDLVAAVQGFRSIVGEHVSIT